GDRTVQVPRVLSLLLAAQRRERGGLAFPRMEVISIDVVDATTALRRRWKTLVAAAIAAGIAGAALASVLPPVRQSEANSAIGAAYGTTLEDPRILARFLESDAFRRSLPVYLTSSVANPVRAQAV